MHSLGMLSAVFLLAGCEVWLDVDTPQCKDNQACVGLLGRGYTCGPAGVCVKSASPSMPAKQDAGASMMTNGGDAATALPARWACLANPPSPITPDRSKTVHVSFDAVDFNTLLPPPGLTADACNPVDIDCNSPILSGAMPDENGFFDFELPYAFAGFFQFNAPNIVPSYSYSNRPATTSDTIDGPSLVTPQTQADIASHSADNVDLSMGFAIIEILDCDGNAADGVHLENLAEGSAPAYYFDGALPSRDLTATVTSTSLGASRNARAVGGFYNLPNGYLTFRATVAKTGTVISEFTVQVRGAHNTYVGLFAGY